MSAPVLTEPAAPPPPPVVSSAPVAEGRGSSLLRRLVPALGILCWFYLSVVAFLFAWVVIVWTVVGWSPMVITTGSMQPAINPGDIVLTAPPGGGADLTEGAVITFEDPVRPGQLVTHRIDTVNSDGSYTTQGDANSAADSYEIQPEQITGIGRLLVPLVGLPRVWMEEGRLVLLVGWVLATLGALWGALHRPRERS